MWHLYDCDMCIHNKGVDRFRSRAHLRRRYFLVMQHRAIGKLYSWPACAANYRQPNWKMSGQQQTLNVVLAAVLISVAACSPPGRAPRRLAPSPDRPISLRELQYSVLHIPGLLEVFTGLFPIMQCSVQGWRSCYQMASDLLNVTHSLHLSIASCLSNPNNSAYETRPSSNTSIGNNTNSDIFIHFFLVADSTGIEQIATSSDNGSGGGGFTRNGTSNSSLAEEPTAAAEELRCIISGSKKVSSFFALFAT